MTTTLISRHWRRRDAEDRETARFTRLLLRIEAAAAPDEVAEVTEVANG